MVQYPLSFITLGCSIKILSPFFVTLGPLRAHGLIFLRPLSLKKKLQLRKSNLKDWRKLVYSLECASATSFREKISLIDIKDEIGPLTSDEVMTRAMSVKELANLEYGKAQDLRKKSKSKWALEGDENSCFFHGIINSNMNRSRINGLNIQGLGDSSYLDQPFSDDEVKDVVYNCGCDKSPGPDGFTFKIFKKYWDVIGGDILSFVKEFETIPISLIGFQYKIIAKVLANRLANVISSVIVGEVQMAFIKGRQIIDVPLMRKWIHSCLDSAFASVLINGSPTSKFKLHHGLRQGDPLSPLLFILAIEAPFIEAKNKNLFHGVEVGVDKVHVSHLQFVDDALILGDWSKPNNENLSRILTCFHLTSGFKVNFSKSSSLPLAPKTIINKLEGIRRKFFWGGSSDTYKIPWIAWNKVISSPKQGGLGIGSLVVSNQALLAKWWWRFLIEDNALWCKVIRSIHGSQGGLHDASLIQSKSGPWYRIAKLNEDLLNDYGINLPFIFKKKIGNGESTHFWLDNWLGGSTLKETFPHIFWLDNQSNCLVCDRAEIMDISNMLANLVLSPSCDIWECVIDDTRSFSVKGMRTHITNTAIALDQNHPRWNKLVPIKVNIASWRIAKGRLLTKINLDLSGIDFHLVNCPLCDDDSETEHHLFIPYRIAKQVWLDVLRWWNLPDANFSTITGLFSLADHTHLTPN
ncbi:RNA-directed DNA polymerase, eukaryota [Tanacetum coccineum]